MKSNLFKGLRTFLFLPLFILVMFTSCQNEETDITETNTEETFDVNSALAQSMFRTATNDGSADNIIDSANCISVNLPVTVIVNGITITIESVEDYDLIEDILEEFEDDIDEVEIQFPITIMLSNYDEIVINNYDELYEFVEECFGENEEDDDIECIDFQYPITISLFNVDFQIIDTIEINDDEELYEFIEELDGSVLASINFPVTMILADGSTIEVNNNDELLAALEEAEDACDEDDDYDYDDDDNDCNEEDVELALKECHWEISEYNNSEELENYYLQFDENYGFIVSINGNVVYDGMWSVEEVEGELVLNLDTDWGDLAGAWTIVECEGDEFYLDNGQVTMEIEQYCEDDIDCSAQEISEYLVECVWYSGTNLLGNDLNGPYMFTEDGTVSFANSTGTTVSGTWNIQLSDQGIYLVLDLPEPYAPISSEWQIIECDEDRIKGVSGDNYVVFEQDCSDPFECYFDAELVVCDDDTLDGLATFDLNYVYPNCVEDNVEVSFYASISDAETQTNPLSTEYTNTSNPQTIYARVQLAGTVMFEIFEVELYVENCNTSGCTEEELDMYLMECHWVAVSYNGDDQLAGYDIYFNENMDLVVEGNGGEFFGTWSTAGNPANGVFLTIEQLPTELQDLIGQWQVVECTEEQIILHANDGNIEIVLERDCSTNTNECTENAVLAHLVECTWNVVNYNGSDDLIIFDLIFNNDGTVTISGDGQTITAMWSTSTTADGAWVEISEVNA